ncbi:hypothetical protein LO763_22820 [Glycomyces sp. A-F 0318]|uniref:hypothetical protein n=1 Tax=Glycomyces amatae TaxID=2881355 RepID=UPI001E3A2568|nr:hypothetical protein [Glycomyces amatae]MCD0446453.1 hypothetical protein [Glycomyces amatae]
MTDAVSDLAGLIAPHWSAEAGPRPGISAAAGLELGQGTVEVWDPLVPGGTRVRYRGIELIDPPVFSSTDMLVIRPGDQVAILSSTPGGGSGAFFVLGRITIPGTAGVGAALDFLRGDLARSLSGEVFADRIYTAAAPGIASHNGTTFGDPDTSGDPGPVIADIPITTGKAIVMISANLKASSDDTASNDQASGGVISYAITGATTVAPSRTDKSLGALVQKYNNNGQVDMVAGINTAATLSKIVVETGLNPGLHTFTMQYSRHPTSTEPMLMDDRTMLVIAF